MRFCFEAKALVDKPALSEHRESNVILSEAEEPALSELRESNVIFEFYSPHLDAKEENKSAITIPRQIAAG